MKVLTFTNVLEVTSKGVVVSDKNGNDNTLVADSIVLAVGLSPNNGPFQAL